ncbi:MAG: tRNA 4-thiouridine(8) synthase ThiI, partial [Candidatus Thorarchaeota archaeon]
MVKLDYSTVILRFGEMAIKSDQTRRRMKNMLMEQVEFALRENNVKFDKVHSVYGRIYIDTSEAVRAAEVAAKVFGIVSTSPTVQTAA